MIVQVYEIQSLEEAKKCVELGIDHVGSVLLDLRVIPRELIKVIEFVKASGRLSSLIPLGQDRKELINAINLLKPNIVHLCDDLSGWPETARELQLELKEKVDGILIMRTIPVPVEYYGRDELNRLISILEPVSDYFLLDTWVERSPVEGFVGITGIPCNWDLAREIVKLSNRPCILAGGLGPHNVYDAIKKVKPYGVDSCTQTNMVDLEGKVIRFRKDFDKLKTFVKEARRGFQEYEVE